MTTLFALVFALIVAVVVLAAAARLRKEPYSRLEAFGNIAKAFLSLLRDGKELVLFALFEVVAIGATALIFLVFGIRVGAFVLIGGVGLFAILAMKPPARKQ